MSRFVRLQGWVWIATVCALAHAACSGEDVSSDAPSAGAASGGSSDAGAPAAGAPAAGAPAAGGQSAEGGAGGAGAPSGGGVAGAGATDAQGGASAGGSGELCASRSGGALIDFQIQADTLRVWIQNDAFIDAAKVHLADETAQVPVFEELLDGADCDAQWSWHPDPNLVSFADFTIELCDGLPSYVEENKQDWFDQVGSYCPWSAIVTAVEDRR